eukprot:TRINITY_DN2122_c0_g4_i1.p1 TRINITY_DN2122_c0_g4~~TRINITY_DN2122_c0_g4_i1.p1  ORF type:complete len:406 (+),score=87.08 TRINITY_DN2122_c0_g4_i1:55-1272(+)
MGKKRRDKDRRQQAEERFGESDGEEGGSLLSGSIGAGAAEEEDETVQIDEFGERVEELSSKTVSDRLDALKELRHVMHRKPHLASTLTKLMQPLSIQISKSIRTGKDDETVSALKTATSAVIFFDDEDFTQSVSRPAVQLLKTGSSSEQIESIRLLTVCYLTDPHLDLDIDDDFPSVLYEMWNKRLSNTSSDVVSEALSKWTLLFTYEDDDTPFVEAGHKVLKMVSSEYFDMSTAALGSIGYMYENCYKKTNKPPAGLGKKEIVETLMEMIGEQDRTVSKQMRKDRKENARKVQATVESNDSPSEQIKVSGKTLDFDGWGEVTQLEWIRSIVKAGLLPHLAASASVRRLLAISHIPLGGKIVKLTNAQKKINADESREKSKLKTMKDHKKSSRAIQHKFGCDDDY